MIMTYDFILTAKREKAFMKQLKEALLSHSDSILCTDIHKLSFHSDKQTVIVTPKSAASDFSWKIVPKKIKYQALIKMLDGDWDNIQPNDITDV